MVSGKLPVLFLLAEFIFLYTAHTWEAGLCPTPICEVEVHRGTLLHLCRGYSRGGRHISVSPYKRLIGLSQETEVIIRKSVGSGLVRCLMTKLLEGGMYFRRFKSIENTLFYLIINFQSAMLPGYVALEMMARNLEDTTACKISYMRTLKNHTP